VNPDVALDLRVDGGSGSSDLDLTDLDLKRLETDVGSGRLVVRLPGGQYEARHDGGSGSASFAVESGAVASMEMGTGSGSTRVTVDEGATLDLRVTDAGSGSISIEVPDGYPLRVDVRDHGSGSLNLPRDAEKVHRGRHDKEGVWESGDPDGEGPKALIRVDDMGSGSVSVRYR
jgi:hypothetical protein